MVQVLILANSHKPGGRCVAGLRLDDLSWVRPVGHREGRALLVHETVAARGAQKFEVRPGDVVEMTLGQPMPTSYHPEDCGYVGGWMLIERLNAHGVLSTVAPVVRTSGELLGWVGTSLDPSTIRPGSESPSLELRRASEVHFHRNHYDPTKLRATLDAVDLSISDPEVELGLDGRSLSALVTVSLSEPFTPKGGTHDLCYKLIAAVILLGAN